MAPLHPAFGAMVYLANLQSRQGLRGTVGSLQAASHAQILNAASEHMLETAFLYGSNPCHSGTAQPTSFPSEKMKRGHYV